MTHPDDTMREAWAASIPYHLRPKLHLDQRGSNGVNTAARAKARRAEYAPDVMRLRATGASHAAIGAAIGLASATVARIIKEHGQ